MLPFFIILIKICNSFKNPTLVQSQAALSKMCSEPRRTWLILFCSMPRKKRALQKHKRDFNNETVFENTFISIHQCVRAFTKKARGRTNTQIFFDARTLHYSFHSGTQALHASKLVQCIKGSSIVQPLTCELLWANKNKNMIHANGFIPITPHDSLLTTKQSNLIDICWITALVYVQTARVSLEERLHYVAIISYLIFWLVPFQ